MVIKTQTPIFIGVPYTVKTPNKSVIINGTDATNDIISINVTPGLNTEPSSCSLVLNNNNGKYTAEFPKGCVVSIYMDYDVASTKIFEGQMYTPIYLTGSQGKTLELDCRGYGYDALKKKVNYEPGTEDTISNLFKYLITNFLVNNYSHSADFSNIETISTTYLPSWSRNTVIDCMNDLIVATSATHDFYCDSDKKWHLFTKGSRVSTESLIYGDNIISMRIVDGDLLTLNNRISLYGEVIDSIPRLKRFDDATSQSQYGIFETEIDDNNIVNMTQLDLKGAAELSINTTLEQHGNSTAVGLPNLLPGYSLYVMNPFSNCIGLKRVIEVTHNFSASGFTTNIIFEEKERGTIYFIKKQIKQSTVKTRWGMDNTYVMKFLTENYGDDTQTPDSNATLKTMNDTVVWEDRLMLELNTNSGYAETRFIDTPSDINQYVVTMSGSNLEGDDSETWITVEVDLGEGWETISKNTIITPTTSSNKIKIRINMISLTSKIRMVAFLWK